MTNVEVPKELVERIYKLIESVKVDGKLRKGTNEATKSVEKNEAQLIISAEDTTPKEIIMHLPIICEKKQIPFVYIPSKSELGAAAGLPISTSAIAIVNPGDAKKQLLTVLKDLEHLKKAEEKGSSEVKADKVEEKPKEEAKPKVEEKKPETKEEVKPKVKEKKPETTEEAKPKVEEKKPETKEEVKPEVKKEKVAETKEETKPEVKEDVKPEVKKEK